LLSILGLGGAAALCTTPHLCFALRAPASVSSSWGEAKSTSRPRERSRAARADGADSGAAILRAEAKASLLDMLEDKLFVEDALQPEGRAMRGQVDESIVQLEKLNPSSEPAYSELIDGSWSVKWAGAYPPGILASPTRELALFLYSGGFSPGNALTSFAGGLLGRAVGIKVVTKTVRIKSGKDVEATAEVEVAGQKGKLSYIAELIPMSRFRVSEEIVSFDLPAPFGKQDAMLELRRNILVTYLDDDLMVVRDESGVPEVLVRDLATVTPSSPVNANATAADSQAAAKNVSSTPR